MPSRSVSGTEGYAAEADALARQYESITFAQAHRPYLHLIPTEAARVLDIGAGTGRDAGALAEMGHQVVAAEPTAEMRAYAARLHPSSRIEWVDDSLPNLAVLTARNERFDLVMMTAVWMHHRRWPAPPRDAECRAPRAAGWHNDPVAAVWPDSCRSAHVRRHRGRDDHAGGGR
jgi:SAM-dependent methyltransferase